MPTKKEIAVGTLRVGAKDLATYKKTAKGWSKSKTKFNELYTVVKLYKAAGKVDTLIDTKNPRFFKGQLSPEAREQGARINVLPTGEKLEKAFSLFSPHLKLHDQDSHDHWDVIYQNKGGTFSYVYTLAKRKEHRARKYRKVDELAKRYATLTKAVASDLKKTGSVMSLAMHTLLNTYMRIGNETYFKAHGHKGLSTLMKKDITIRGNNVTFNYVGKDGVPIQISKSFPNYYVKSLKTILREKKQNEFVFAKNKHPLHERDFKIAFKAYCGKEFYPHIIRSHHATTKVRDYVKGRRKLAKEEVRHLFMSVAHDLGHKKFDKKTQTWQDSFSVTVTSYVQPELVEKVWQKVKKE